MEQKNNAIVTNGEYTITIKERWDDIYRTITVEGEGGVIYSQTRDHYCHEGTKTFLDDFLERLGSGYEAPEKTSCDTRYIVPDGGNFFYFISKRRLKTLNFKQKFLHFLLKHLFLHGETPTIKNIKSLCIKEKIESGEPIS